MNGRTWFLLLLSIFWIFFCQRWYCCWMQIACDECTDTPINHLPIGFLPGQVEPDTANGFQDLIKKIDSDRPANSYLEISGHYSENEPSENDQNLGFARAEKAKSLLASFFPKDSLHTRSQKLLKALPEKAAYHGLVEMQWIQFPPKPNVPNDLIIHFPNKNAKVQISLDYQTRLRELMTYALSSNSNLVVEGHADQTGQEVFNEKYSLERAQIIKEMLTSFGFPENRIEIKAFGSSQPISSTNTELNRRVEIKLAK